MTSNQSDIVAVCRLVYIFIGDKLRSPSRAVINEEGAQPPVIVVSVILLIVKMLPRGERGL